VVTVIGYNIYDLWWLTVNMNYTCVRHISECKRLSNSSIKDCFLSSDFFHYPPKPECRWCMWGESRILDIFYIAVKWLEPLLHILNCQDLNCYSKWWHENVLSKMELVNELVLTCQWNCLHNHVLIPLVTI
jgi:hypothetical protein